MQRFEVTYRLVADNLSKAKELADIITVEQTVEIPRDTVPAGYIEDELLGRVEDIYDENKNSFIANISYNNDSVGKEFIQLLNVVHGNSSMYRGVKAIDIKLNEYLEKIFKGPQYGIEGIRKLCNKKSGGLIAPVIKPQGLSADELAEIAYKCALGGANIIKDDHGLANQSMAPFYERVEKINNAIKKSNKETGNNCLYFPNIAGNFNELIKYCEFSRDIGVGGLMIMPALTGFDIVRYLSSSNDFNLPILTHPTFIGSYVLSNDAGFSHSMMFGKIQRLAGSDISVFPNTGGRFGFTIEECNSIAHACRSNELKCKKIFPSPGGGMSIETINSMKRMYGNDAVFLFGGSLLRDHDKIIDNIKEINKLL